MCTTRTPRSAPPTHRFDTVGRALGRLGLALTAGALAVGIAGCTPSAAADPPGGGTPPDGVWMLVSASDADGDLPVGAGRVTLAFGTGDDDGTTPGAGLGGEVCNAYGANLTGGVGRGSAAELRVTEVFSTQMWCEAEGLMDLETRYLAALQEVSEAQLIDGAIVMAGNDVRLRFVQG